MSITLAKPRNLSYLAFLAWPDGDSASHERFIKSGMFVAYKKAGFQPKQMPDEITAVPGSLARKEDVLNRGLRRIRERRIAAAYTFLRLAEGRRNDFFEIRGAETIAAGFEHWWSLAWPEDNGEHRHSADVTHNNARKRIWRDSQPVLPMTLALMFSKQSVSALFARMGGEEGCGDVKLDGPVSAGWPWLLSHTQWVDTALETLHNIPLGDNEGGFLLPTA